MQTPPFLPISEKKRIQLEVLAFEGPGNSSQAGLLPAAAGFVVLKNFVASDDTGIVHVKFTSLASGPKQGPCCSSFTR